MCVTENSPKKYGKKHNKLEPLILRFKNKPTFHMQESTCNREYRGTAATIVQDNPGVKTPSRNQTNEVTEPCSGTVYIEESTGPHTENRAGRKSHGRENCPQVAETSVCPELARWHALRSEFCLRLRKAKSGRTLLQKIKKTGEPDQILCKRIRRGRRTKGVGEPWASQRKT
jgi:hypothetical protein